MNRLDDAIEYYSKIAETLRKQVRIEDNDYMDKVDEVYTCEQLAEWLNELKLLRKRIDAHPEQRWIPCSERLPFAECGESNNVLATCGYRGVEDTSIRWIRTLYFNGGCWCYPTGETYDQKVYAWMPLPEPYKTESEDKE